MNAVYEIRDRAGALVALHERIEGPDGKRFIWKLPDGTNGLDGRVSMADMPLFGSDVFGRQPLSYGIVVEGEKAAKALIDLGLPAVGTVCGASAAPGPSALEVLRDRYALLWPDADEIGRQHMERVAKGLQGIAVGTAWVDVPPGVPKGWDAADAALQGVTYVRQLIAGKPAILRKTERTVAELSKDERRQIALWAVAMLMQPPLSGDAPQWTPLRAVLRAFESDLTAGS